MQPQNGVKTWQWVVTAIVIIALIIIGILVFGHKQPAPTSETDMTSNNPTTVGQINRIVMSDQYPGNVVYISSVQLANPGWVVIQSDNNGTPGAVIGQLWLSAGINPAKVTLTKATVDGGTYYAVLYSDNGDQKFSATTDLPLKDTNGNTILHVFHASSDVSSLEVKG